MKKDTSILDSIITGRVQPHIYAFRTGTIPDYLKVGDTYRPVDIRLKEWEAKYKFLEEVYREKASVDKDIFFRDFAVHQYLEEMLELHRLRKEEIAPDIYYSNEFFQKATRENVASAIEDIRSDFAKGGRQYHFYRFDESRIPIEEHYHRSEKEFEPRKEQQDTVERFIKAKDAGRKNLLMYAVMRFGKSFTSMLCAKAMGAKLVVVLCGKTTVKDEWKRNVEIPKNFEEYSFKDSNSLKNNHHLISEAKEAGEKIVLFLTLQDLAGDDVKERHKELFENKIDLIIVDETHFGARAPEYGKVLNQEFGVKTTTSLKECQDEDDIEEVGRKLKFFDANIKLHLSGTPYRILMGSEFEAEDIIAFYRFTDIVDAQEEWDKNHLDVPEIKEWDNPYYGFPQMIRFAFNPSESARKLIKNLREQGRTCALSALFEPQSITKDAGKKYRIFKHEQEVCELLEVIDGSREDDELFGFLNYDKIKDGQMCRHLVCVLPFRASCDALQKLLKDYKDKFKNLPGYEILNIAGHDCPKSLQLPERIKETIGKLEEEGKKTVTLTVNKMLTGSTVEQWDTILFFKDTSSPQEYDQAIFRIQNPFVKNMTSRDAEEGEREIKYNMKPQTLLVDFDPNRMFRLQEMKSQFDIVNSETKGNARLKECIEKELSVSPIIVLNKNRLQEVTPTNITDVVREYSQNRSILEDASEIPSDKTLLEDEDILKVIKGIAPIDAKNGLQIKPTEGEGEDMDSPDADDKRTDDARQDTTHDTQATGNRADTEEDDKLEKRLTAYYARILFFSFLTESTVKSLEDVIAQIPATEANRRIAKHLGIDMEVLKAIQLKSNPFVLRKFDYKIENINDLVRDDKLQPIERVEVAMRKFGRLSDSEIVTPAKVADEMVSVLPYDELNAQDNIKFLDIAAKQGEFTIALYKRFGEKAKNNIYAVPTSKLTYEFTRKTYSLLGMPVENIFADFTSYDLIGKNNEMIIKQLTDMNFNILIGNPPYQIQNNGKGNGSDPIYHLFIDVAQILAPSGAMIHPGRFLFNAGKTPKVWNKKVLNNTHFMVLNYWQKSIEVFPNVDVKGGIAVTMWDKKKTFAPIRFFSVYKELRSILDKVKPDTIHSLSTIVGPREAYGLTKQLYIEHPELAARQSKGHKFSLGANIYEVIPEVFSNEPEEGMIAIYGRYNNERGYKWIKESYISKHNSFKYYKVILPEANGSGAIGEVLITPIIGTPIIGTPNMGYTDTFLSIGLFENEHEAEACLKYVKTKFARTMLGTLKATQHNSKNTWVNVPLQDFTSNSDIDWGKSIAKIDAQLYAKYGLTDKEINFIESMIKPM